MSDARDWWGNRERGWYLCHYTGWELLYFLMRQLIQSKHAHLRLYFYKWIAFVIGKLQEVKWTCQWFSILGGSIHNARRWPLAVRASLCPVSRLLRLRRRKLPLTLSRSQAQESWPGRRGNAFVWHRDSRCSVRSVGDAVLILTRPLTFLGSDLNSDAEEVKGNQFMVHSGDLFCFFVWSDALINLVFFLVHDKLRDAITRVLSVLSNIRVFIICLCDANIIGTAIAFFSSILWCQKKIFCCCFCCY